MDNDEIRMALRRILQDDLRDCESAIRRGDTMRAKQKLEESTAKINRVISNIPARTS